MKQKELCIECCDVLTNPICIDCLIKQMFLWFEDNNINPRIRFVILSKLKKKFYDYLGVYFDMECVICGNHNVALCGYCFTRYVYLYLKNLNVHENVLENFLEIFGYWKWHSDFRKIKLQVFNL